MEVMKHNAIYRSNTFVHAVCVYNYAILWPVIIIMTFILSVRVCFILAAEP
jgi:hypothetical protein